jgi:hypothetical protein
MYSEEPHGWPGPERPVPPAKAPWSGSGGRWTVWPMRIILWAAVLVVAYRGVMAIVLNEKPASSAGAAATASGPAAQFPVTLAEAFAMEFGHVYLTYDPAHPETRQAQLYPFVPPDVLGAHQSFGLVAGQDAMQVNSESVVGIDTRSANSAVVTLLANVNNHEIELGVPVYAANGGIVVSGLPSLLAAPLMVGPPQPQRFQQDTGAASQLNDQLPGFFRAYADGGPAKLKPFLAAGVSLVGLGNEVQFQQIAPGSLHVPQGGATRNITVTVNWQLAQQQTGFAATYDVTVVVSQGDKWYVKGIRASTQPMGTAP